MKGYKGFNKTLQCRGKQYEIGKEYAEESAKLCKEGLHFCEYPLDVFNYYPPSESAFCEVDAPDDFVSPQTSTDSKRVSTKLTIGAKLELHTLIEAAIKFTFDRAKKSGNTKHATGPRGAASATGYQGAASATGPRGAASATGERGAASATGPRGAAIALGIEGKAKASLANWIILSEWEYANDSWERKTIKAFKVDGKKMKADTYYTLKDGEAVEAE